jgi:hypothetical protein
MHVQMDSNLKYSVADPEAKPLVFIPTVDFSTLEDPSIVDAF